VKVCDSGDGCGNLCRRHSLHSSSRPLRPCPTLQGPDALRGGQDKLTNPLHHDGKRFFVFVEMWAVPLSYTQLFTTAEAMQS